MHSAVHKWWRNDAVSRLWGMITLVFTPTLKFNWPINQTHFQIWTFPHSKFYYCGCVNKCSSPFYYSNPAGGFNQLSEALVPSFPQFQIPVPPPVQSRFQTFPQHFFSKGGRFSSRGFPSKANTAVNSEKLSHQTAKMLHTEGNLVTHNTARAVQSADSCDRGGAVTLFPKGERAVTTWTLHKTFEACTHTHAHTTFNSPSILKWDEMRFTQPKKQKQLVINTIKLWTEFDCARRAFTLVLRFLPLPSALWFDVANNHESGCWARPHSC